MWSNHFTNFPQMGYYEPKLELTDEHYGDNQGVIIHGRQRDSKKDWG